jgi:diguanylate cyclase (GGDEF)-like protein
MFLDLDGFKSVNDRLGHGIGDCVLKAVSTRLLGLVRPSDTVARLGGDEFVILLDNPESRDSVAMIASRVIESVNAPMDFDGIGAHVGTSIGITFFAEGMPSPDALLKSADDAMYAAKASGKNCYRFAN